jgi:erythromycin esterase-like protein
MKIATTLRSGQTLSADQVLTAIGGLWKFDGEFQPLAPFLAAKAQAGQIVLGGIDDQLGQLGQDYANVQMVEQFTALLPEQRRQGCKRDLHQRIYSDYTDASPYSETDRGRITTCLSEIERAVAADEGMDREDRLEMVAAFQRWVARDFTTDIQDIAGRDHSMFQNFEWLLRRNSKQHKVILWAATVHIAKRPSWGDEKGKNFGSYVDEAYGTRAFSLGFSALAGSYRQGRNNVHEMPLAPADSLERQALQGGGSESVYIGRARLKQLGTAPGEIFRHSFETRTWSTFLDGVVVFPAEYPPLSPKRP